MWPAMWYAWDMDITQRLKLAGNVYSELREEVIPQVIKVPSGEPFRWNEAIGKYESSHREGRYLLLEVDEDGNPVEITPEVQWGIIS